jgi:hypothetical protein
MELAEYISLGASALEILRILVSIFRRLGKKKEADATEKAIKEIESEKKTTEAEARAVTQKVLRDELNEEEAKEVLDVISALEGLFPIHPKGEVLEYGLALNDLISESIVALEKIKTFKILGIDTGEKIKRGKYLGLWSMVARRIPFTKVEFKPTFYPKIMYSALFLYRLLKAKMIHIKKSL